MSFFLFKMKAKVEHECIVKRLKYTININLLFNKDLFIHRCRLFLWKAL